MNASILLLSMGRFFKSEMENINLSNATVVLYDGACLLCDRLVQFILRHEGRVAFYFLPLLSPQVEKIINLPPEGDISDTIVLLHNGKTFTSSDAVIRIAGLLRFPWKLAVVFYLVPRVIRNWLYLVIARNRYRWFGKVESCRIFDGKYRGRLLDANPDFQNS